MSSQPFLLARRYAKALFELALEKQQLERISEEMESLHEILASSDEVRQAFLSPVLGKKEHYQLIETLAKKADFSAIIKQFLMVVVRNGRLSLLTIIIRSFAEQVKQYQGEVTADVISAVKLDASQQKELEEVLSKRYGKTVAVAITIDPSILGGIIVTVGSKRWDDSLLTKINRLALLEKQAMASV